MTHLKWYLIFAAAAVLGSGMVQGQDANKTEGFKYPDPARWAEAIKAFTEWDEKNTYPSDAVLFVGSSSIRFWKTAEAFPQYPMINRGFGGSYMADSVHYINEVVLKYKPKVVVVYAGDNDVAGKIPAEAIGRDFAALVQAIHTALPHTEIVCLPIKPSRMRWHLWESMKAVNALNKAFAETCDYVTFVDTASPLLGAEGLPTEDLFMKDQLHLSEKGYAVWNRILAPVLEEKYQKVTDKDNGRGK